MSRRNEPLPQQSDDPAPTAKDETDGDRSRREQEDQARDREVYQYLLTLTDLEPTASKRDPDKFQKPNESSIAKQWNMERIFVRRVLRSVLHEQYYRDQPEQPVPGLTLGKLVKILLALQNYWEQRRPIDRSTRVPRILTYAEKRLALQKFVRLSVNERESLQMPIHPGEALLQRLLEEAIDPVKGLDLEAIIQLYRSSLQHQAQARSQSRHQGGHAQAQDRLSDSERQELIRDRVTALVKAHFAGLEEKRSTDKINEFVEKVEREVNRIKFQSGMNQAESYLDKKHCSKDAETYPDYLTADFIRRLTQAVVDNEILTDELPIYLKFFQITNVQPLPLYIQREGQASGLLNVHLLNQGEDPGSISGLEKQFAYKASLHFYIRLPEDYQVKFPHITTVRQDVDRQEAGAKAGTGHRQLEFSEEITGIGSPLSHMVTIINRVLLWDIPELKDYLLIPDEVMNHDESIGGDNHGPVWSHSLVRLYTNEDINRAIAQDRPCDQVAETFGIAHGEYCGFDLIEVALKAALHARLKLIKQIGIKPQEYLAQLCCKIEELGALNRAKTYLNFYPFSLRAMAGELEATIFRDRYRQKLNDFTFRDQDPEQPWTMVALEAHLAIAETNLKEGLYRVAKRYLDIVEPFFQEESNCSIGNTTFVRYYLCRFRYAYLSDLGDGDYPYPDRYQAVREAEKQLDKAQQLLNRRLEKFYKLNELPQSNFHPYFHLLSQLYAHRAKLYIFFPTYARPSEQGDTLIESLSLLEKARICAARDGDPTLYAQWSAYQSWCYLMVAYLGTQNQDPEFSQTHCIDWAERLIVHALQCYAPRGNACYQQIKDNGGKTTDVPKEQLYKAEAIETGSEQLPQVGSKAAEDQTNSIATKRDVSKIYYESYGKTRIRAVPLIREVNPESTAQERDYDVGKDVLGLDISILKQIQQNPESKVYLFGTIASIILFAMGMLELCKEQQTDPLRRSIEDKALRMFTYCWAIASDGTSREDPQNIEGDYLVLNRVLSAQKRDNSAHSAYAEDDPFHPKDLLLRGLYPHRLTQFADLGKIFFAVCQLLLLIASPQMQAYYADEDEDSWGAIEPKTTALLALIRELCTNNEFPTTEVLGQQRYNGHLAEHFKAIEKYFSDLIDKRLKEKQLTTLDIVYHRNRIVADIFKIIRGESNVTP